jgi:hypothetical protein
MEGRQYNCRMDLLILYHMKTEVAYMHYMLYWQYMANISLVFYFFDVIPPCLLPLLVAFLAI